jgi:hypothetical protein
MPVVPHPFPRASGLLVALLIGALGSSAWAGAPPEDDVPFVVSQRRFGFGPTLGFLSGSGLTMGGGGDVVRGWFTGGFMPILLFGHTRGSNQDLHFNYYSSLQINEDLAFHLFRRPRVEGSLLVGYKYNTVLGHGGGAGLGIVYDLGARVGLQINLGVAVFPSAKDRLIRDHGYPIDRDASFPPAIQGGGNIGLVFFP